MTLLAPGRRITPTLSLVRELNRGGMGSVWLAEHESLRSQVAVKFLTEGSLAMPDAVERFSREAAAAARVRSPHVVQVFDHGISDDTPYIVMELLTGEDLAHKLERDKRLSLDETIAVITQVCKALERAHAEGIVHRDIKPANVFLVEDPEGAPLVKVLDFGLAKHDKGGLSDLTANGAIFGTPHYLSPEQAGSARDVTPRSDLWSVAVITYQCLTGTRPYQGESLIELCAALAATTFPPATSVFPELPPAVDAWFTRAFQRDPAARFGSASELAQALAVALSAPLEAAPPVAVPLAPDSTAAQPRRRIAVGVLAAAALALGGFLAVSSTSGTRTAAPSGPSPGVSPSLAQSAVGPSPPGSAERATTSPIVTAAVVEAPRAPASTLVADATPARTGPRSRPAKAAPRESTSASPPADELFSDPKR